MARAHRRRGSAAAAAPAAGCAWAQSVVTGAATPNNKKAQLQIQLYIAAVRAGEAQITPKLRKHPPPPSARRPRAAPHLCPHSRSRRPDDAREFVVAVGGRAARARTRRTRKRTARPTLRPPGKMPTAQRPSGTRSAPERTFRASAGQCATCRKVACMRNPAPGILSRPSPLRGLHSGLDAFVSLFLVERPKGSVPRLSPLLVTGLVQMTREHGCSSLSGVVPGIEA
eukprot:scaffold501_cov407-Prasinococcus_capsulatus_cf.AAC.11